MLLLKLMNTPLKRKIPGYLVHRGTLIKKVHYEPMCSLANNNNSLLNSLDPTYSNRTKPFETQHLRLLHVTKANRDLENAVKAMGAGFSAISLIGPGIGLGYIFGNVCSSMARNPSVGNRIFQFAILGAALCESIGFFGLMISFLILF